jgi:hypothetical protein
LFAAGAPALAIWRTGNLGRRNVGVKMRALVVCLVGLYACGVIAADEQGGGAEREELQGIDDQVQTLKKEIIQINHELSLLEEKLLFPSTTQVAIFVSVMAQPEFRMDSLELSVDDQVVAKYIYTFRELEALHKGGVQRLHTANITTGDHKLALVVRGKTAGGDDFQISNNVTVKKDVDPKFVEVQIVADSGQPSVKFKDW